MYTTFYYIGIACAVFAVMFLTTSVIMFIKFHIPTLIKDSRGTLAQGQIDEIRNKNSKDAARNRVNVFEEMEQKAKVNGSNDQDNNYKASISSSLRRTAAAVMPSPSANIGADSGTTVLSSHKKTVDPDFIIEKNIMFVSTSEVI